MRKIYSFINGLEVLHLIGNLNLTFPHIKHFGSLTCLARNSGYQLKLNTVFCFVFFFNFKAHTKKSAKRKKKFMK